MGQESYKQEKRKDCFRNGNLTFWEKAEDLSSRLSHLPLGDGQGPVTDR